MDPLLLTRPTPTLSPQELGAPSSSHLPPIELKKVANVSVSPSDAPIGDGYAIREEDYSSFDITRYTAKPPSPFKKGGATSFFVEGTYAYDTIVKGRKTGGRTVAPCKIEFPHSDGNRLVCKGGLMDKKNYTKEELEHMDRDPSYVAEGTSSGDFKAMYELDHINNPIHKLLMRILMEIYRAHILYMARYGSKGLLLPGKKYAFKAGLMQLDCLDVEEDHLTCPVWFKEKDAIRKNPDTGENEPIKVRDLESVATLKLISGHAEERKVHSKWFTLPKEEVRNAEGTLVNIKIGDPQIIPPEQLIRKSIDTIPLVKISSIINPSPLIRLMVDSSYVKDVYAIGSIEQKITVDREREAMLAAFEAARPVRSKYEDAISAATGVGSETELTASSGANSGQSSPGLPISLASSVDGTASEPAAHKLPVLADMS